jgi:hypothetical protein
MPTFMPVGWNGAPVPSYGGAGQMVSPTDTISPTSPFAGPFTPATPWGMSYAEPSIVSDSPCRSPGASFPIAPEYLSLSSALEPPAPAPAAPSPTPFDQLPVLCNMPWTFEFSGEFVPSGADFLLDADFDLSQIPSVTLDELKEIDGGAHPLSSWDFSHVDLSPASAVTSRMVTSAPAADAAGQDPFMYFG